MSQPRRPSLRAPAGIRFQDGGNFVTRWAQNVMRPKNTEQRLRQIEAPPPAPAPAPRPPNPNATPDNPAGIRFQDGGGLSKDAVMEAIARQRAAAGGQSGGGSGTAPQTQPQPQPQQPSMLRDFLRNPGSVLRDRERAAGLRFQDGGHVPGTGEGDKIPAKYEPGEFVVSNDMIDDNPGLREQLSGLRAETLAARGKTVEEADAQALRHAGGLRAVDGFDPLDRMAKDLTGQNSLPPKSPVGNMADDLARNARAAARQIVRPTASLPPEAAAAYDASPEGRATKAQVLKDTRGYFQGKTSAAAAPAGASAPPAPPAPAAPSTTSKLFGSADDWKKFASGPADSPHKTGRLTLSEAPSGKPGMAGKAVGVLGKAAGAAQGLVGAYDVYKGVQEGDMQRAGVGAADALAAGALFTPAAPVAGAYLGARGAWDSGKAIYDNLSEGTQDVIGGTVNQIGLNTGLWGEDDSTKLMADAQARAGQPADTPRKTAPGAPTPDLRNPYADANAAKIAASDAQNKAAAPDTPTSSPGLPAGVYKHGRGQYSDSASGMGMPAGFTGQPNPQNEAIWQRMADRSQAESMARVQGGLRGGGPGSGPVEPGSFTGGYSGVIGSSDTYGNMRGRSHEQRLRDAEVSAGSIMNTRKWGGPGAENNPSAVAYRNMLEQDAQIPKTAAAERIAASKNATDIENTRYSSDNTLRGTVYSADATRAGQMATARSKQQELAYNRQRDALKDSMDIEGHNQTIRHNATSNARDRLKGMAVRDDGKGGTVVDEGRLARLESTLTKMSPGWALADEKTQAGLLRKAEASVNILEGLNNQRNNGWLQAFGIDGKNMQLDNLPHKEMKGAKLGEVGFVDGVTTPGTGRKDYVIETPGGHKLYLPRSSVNQGELELFKSLGVDVTGIKK
jgi:hypothetical protein